MYRTSGNFATTARVASVDPSSTTITSTGERCASVYARILRKLASMRCSSLYAGTTMLNQVSAMMGGRISRRPCGAHSAQAARFSTHQWEGDAAAARLVAAWLYSAGTAKVSAGRFFTSILVTLAVVTYGFALASDSLILAA